MAATRCLEGGASADMASEQSCCGTCVTHGVWHKARLRRVLAVGWQHASSSCAGAYRTPRHTAHSPEASSTRLSGPQRRSGARAAAHGS